MQYTVTILTVYTYGSVNHKLILKHVAYTLLCMYVGDKLVTISYWDHSVIEFSKESRDAVIVNVNVKVSN